MLAATTTLETSKKHMERKIDSDEVVRVSKTNV